MAGLSTTQILLDDGSGTFPLDITSKVLLTPGITLRRGRDDWQGGVTTGELTLTLNNGDGRFTPGSTILGSPSPIKVDQRIRFKETVNGVTFTRFTGYVKAWPVAWPAVVSSHSTVSITATDAQARAERRPLRSVVEEEILKDLPAAYYTFGEPAGAAAAADSSGNQQPFMAQARSGAAVVFGNATGPVTDDLTAAQFTGGGETLAAVFAAPLSVVGMVCAFATTATNTTFLTTLAGFGAFGVNGSGQPYFQALTAAFPLVTSGTAANDGNTHVAEAYYSGGNVSFYLDGALVGSAAASVPDSSRQLQAGCDSGTVTLAHAAVFTTAPGGTRAAEHAQAMLTGFAGESGTARLARIAGYAGLPQGTFDTSLTNLPAVDIATGDRVPGAADIACESALSQRPVWIRALNEGEAAGGYCTAAIHTVSQVAEELGMDPTTLGVTLFARCEPDHPDATEARQGLNGFVRDGANVFLSAELTAPQLLETAAHETRHVWQHRQGWPAFQSRQAIEHDARTYGRAWAAKRLESEWRRQNPGQPMPTALASTIARARA